MARRKRLNSEESAAAGTPQAPHVRVWTDWSPKQIKSAEWQAEAGDYTYAVSICDWLLADDRIAGALDARMEALLGLIPTFEPSGDRRRSNRAVKALEADEDWWQAYPINQLALIHKWALLLGIAPAHQGWKAAPDHGGRVLPVLEFWHPQTLRRDYQRGIWTIRDIKGQDLVVAPGDGEWVLHAPFGESRPWNYGLWRSLSRWTMFKWFARGDSGAAGEKASTLVATSPAGSTKEQRQELAASLLASGPDRLAVLAAGYDMKLLELSAATGQLFKEQIAMADNAIAIRIRGGNLTSEVKEGSRAAAETQQKANEEPKLRFDAEALSTTLNAQSLAWWATYNFGDASLAPWPCWPVEPEEDKGERASTVKVVAEGIEILDRLGFEIDTDELVEDFGLEFITGRTKPNAPPAPPVGPGAQLAPGAPKAPPKQLALARALASGDPVSQNPGFLAGQIYTDAVVESATQAGTQALEPTIEAIAREIDAATSYDDLRARLTALYPKLDGSRLNELVYRAMLLGELAGRAASTQDQ